MKLNFTYPSPRIKNKELYNLIVNRAGGKTTMDILDEILIRPQNANQIANRLGLDYKTVTYHMKIICNHNFATKEKFDNYHSYHPSDKLIKNLDEYMIIKEYYGKQEHFK